MTNHKKDSYNIEQLEENPRPDWWKCYCKERDFGYCICSYLRKQKFSAKNKKRKRFLVKPQKKDDV